jgi:hypothetical protein
MKMSQKIRIVVFLTILAAQSGCGQVQSVSGGTRGRLMAGGNPLSEIQVTVYQGNGSNSPKPLGFGVSATDGSFELVQNGAHGPLRLSPGEYCCTLESVGAPVRLANEYLHAEKTPLKVVWVAGDARLDLEIPSPPPL